MLSLVFAARLEIKLRYTIKEIQLRNTMLNLIGIRDTFKMSPQKMEGRRISSLMDRISQAYQALGLQKRQKAGSRGKDLGKTKC